jgi:hypothetical protein
MNMPEKIVWIPRIDKIMAIMAFWAASRAPKPDPPHLKRTLKPRITPDASSTTPKVSSFSREW